MTAATVNYIISLVDCTCFLLIIFYLIIRSQLFYDTLIKKDQPQKLFILVLIYSAFSIYGVLVSVLLERSVVTIGIVGPIAGALTCGFRVGAGAGLIGAAAGMYLHGSVSQASILFAGLAAGVFSLARARSSTRIADAAALAFCCAILAEIAMMFFWPREAHDMILMPVAALISTLGVTGMAFLIERLIEERQTSAAKELIDSELRIASDIQMSIVPKTFPPLPNLPDLDVFAVLKPAREIGGDFYDFFPVDGDHFFFTVGDVGSKGMPAALFMAVARTLIKSNAEPGVGPDMILKHVNDILCRENDSSISVTVFCGIVNIRSGEVTYSNAGHIPPYVYRRNGSLESVRLPEGMALGTREGLAFGQDRLVLAPGDAIVVCTNGVNEATDADLRRYDAARLEAAIKSDPLTASRGLVARILEDIERFTAGVERADDITILSLAYIPVRHS